MLSFRNLVLSAAALCSTAAFAANQTRLDVPFSFKVKNHSYQAGSYTVAIDPQRSAMTLNNIDKPSQGLMWIVGPGVYDANEPAVRLTFDVIGGDHMLRTVQFGSGHHTESGRAAEAQGGVDHDHRRVDSPGKVRGRRPLWCSHKGASFLFSGALSYDCRFF